MEIILILIVVAAILFFIGKHILFNVYVNSVLFIIAEIVILSYVIENFESGASYTASWILFGLCLCDCIRDLALGNKFYKEISDGIDTRFAIKSLISTAMAVLAFLVVSEILFIPEASIMLIFVPRIAFLLIVNPLTKIKVNKDVKDKFIVGYPLPFQKWMYSSDAAEQYYYKKITKKLFDDGKLVTNAEIVFEERDTNRQKVDNRCPKKLFDRIKNTLFTSSEEKEQAQQTENRIKRMHRHTAYINSAFYGEGDHKAVMIKGKARAFP